MDMYDFLVLLRKMLPTKTAPRADMSQFTCLEGYYHSSAGGGGKLNFCKIKFLRKVGTKSSLDASIYFN